MIRFEKESKIGIIGKGKLKKFSANGIDIIDDKTGEIKTISAEKINELIDCDVSISFVTKSKEDNE